MCHRLVRLENWIMQVKINPFYTPESMVGTSTLEASSTRDILSAITVPVPIAPWYTHHTYLLHSAPGSMPMS